jgi:hypothetical protein
MTSAGITQHLRDGALSDVASDIPAGVTIAEYAAARRHKPSPSLRTRVVSILLQRKSR